MIKDPNADLTDLEMMLSPERWPNWSADAKIGILPLKHRDGTGDEGYGLLMARAIADGKFEYAWEWKAMLFDLKQPVFDHSATGSQELIRLLVQCGWVVD